MSLSLSLCLCDCGWALLNRLRCCLGTMFRSPNLYLHHLITVQPLRSTRFSSLATLTRPPASSSLRITDRAFRYASPRLWNQLPPSLRQPYLTSDSLSFLARSAKLPSSRRASGECRWTVNTQSTGCQAHCPTHSRHPHRRWRHLASSRWRHSTPPSWYSSTQAAMDRDAVVLQPI